jgi:hypothetical protein
MGNRQTTFTSDGGTPPFVPADGGSNLSGLSEGKRAFQELVETDQRAGAASPEEARRALRDLAAERQDTTSQGLLGVTVLSAAGAAVALSAVPGPAWLLGVAGALLVGAVVVFGLVRQRLRHELLVVAEAQGLDTIAARREVEDLLRGVLRGGSLKTN